MAGPLDLTGQNIENTYQRILQTDGTLIYDGTGSLFNISGSGISNTGSFTGSFTGSLQGTASYALNGGVTQILAGPNITLSPTNGLGQVTVSATLSGSTIFNTATGSYGSFYDTTTQTNPVANVPRSMSFDSTDITNGVSISGSTNPYNTYIKTQNAGVYNIQFSAQVDKTDAGSDEIVIWLRKNGSDLTDTATTLTLSGNNDKQVAAWNWFVNSAANDYYQIIWISADTNVRLLAESISATHPGIPSVILTVNRIDQFLSNTGSFTGSFTGNLFGTSSWANTASISLYPINVTGSSIYSTGPATGNVSANNGIFLGGSAGGGATSANLSVFLGYLAGQLATNANEAIIIGPAAGLEATKANNSVLLGSGAGYKAVSASYSTIIGSYAGSAVDAPSLSVGTNNIIIGNYVTLPSKSRDSINLGGIIFATGSYSTLGTVYSGSQYNIGRVGINKVTPTYTLDVSGSGNYSNGLIVTGSLIAPTITGSLLGTSSYASQALSSSYALTASYVELAQTASYILQAVSASYATNALSASYAPNTTFPYTGNAVISGSLTVTGSATFIGRISQTGLGSSIFIGQNAGFTDDLTTNVNVAIGNNALYFNKDGTNNIAIGQSTLFNNTGSNNVALGAYALQLKTIGGENMAIGTYALNQLSTGSGNVAVGNLTLFNAQGNYNVGIGGNALYDVAGGLNTGRGNIGIGYNTGRGITTGEYNTIIGASVTGLSSSLSNNIIIADGVGNIAFRVNPTTGLTGLTRIIPRTTTNQTATTEISAFIFNGVTTTWQTGNITAQRNFYLPSQTYAFNGASTITNAYGLYAEAPTAGTNATITNNYAAGFSGSVQILTGGLEVASDITANTFASTNNGNGTNFKVGDDAWIGDINTADTLGIKGQQNATKGYIKFGSGSLNPILGSGGTSTLELTGSLSLASGSITLTTGSITMPNRPAFRVTGAGGAKVAVTALSGSYLNVDYQQGSGWDNATGTFTAPVAGLYQVNVVVRTNSNSLGTISQLIVYKNNTGGTTGTVQIMIEFGANTTMNHAGGSTISKLAVGDTLKMVVAVGEISFDVNDNFSVAYIG